MMVSRKRRRWHVQLGCARGYVRRTTQRGCSARSNYFHSSVFLSTSFRLLTYSFEFFLQRCFLAPSPAFLLAVSCPHVLLGAIIYLFFLFSPPFFCRCIFLLTLSQVCHWQRPPSPVPFPGCLSSSFPQPCCPSCLFILSLLNSYSFPVHLFVIFSDPYLSLYLAGASF
jgi:hypothetical protein